MWIPLALAALVATLPVIAPLRAARSTRALDLVFAALAGAAGAGFAAIGHFQGSALFLVPAGVWTAAAILLGSRAGGLPVFALIAAVGALAFGGMEVRRAWRAVPATTRLDWGTGLEARDQALAARLATRTADERVAMLVLDGRCLAPETAAALARSADVEAVIDIAPTDGERGGHEALRAESAFAVAELPLFAAAARDEAARTRGFLVLRPRPYVEIVIASELPDRFDELARTLAQAGAASRTAGTRRILVLDDLPGADDPVGEALRGFVRRERFTAVLHRTEEESRAVADGEVTWIGIGRGDTATARAVRIVVEPFGVDAERLEARPLRRPSTSPEVIPFAGAWARTGRRSALALVSLLAGGFAILGLPLLRRARD